MTISPTTQSIASAIRTFVLFMHPVSNSDILSLSALFSSFKAIISSFNESKLISETESRLISSVKL